MLSPKINSYPFSNPVIEAKMRETIEAEMKKQGITPTIKQPASIFAGLQIKKREPMREHELSTEEFLNLFDKAESLRMAYIPHFITQCVIYYLDLLVEYAKENRLSEYKKHTRQLKEIKQEYIAALQHEMPPHVFQKFLAQRDEYLASCGSNLTLMYFSFGNLLLKHYGRLTHEAMYCYGNIIVAFIEYVEDFDRQVNNRIAEKLGKPCRNHGDARLTAIKAVCKDIIKAYPLGKDDIIALCIGVMRNRAVAMINDML